MRAESEGAQAAGSAGDRERLRVQRLPMRITFGVSRALTIVRSDRSCERLLGANAKTATGACTDRSLIQRGQGRQPTEVSCRESAQCILSRPLEGRQYEDGQEAKQATAPVRHA